MLAPGVFPPDSGGPATFAPHLASALADRDHTVEVVTNGTVEAGYDDRYPFEVVRVPKGGSAPRRYARQILALNKAVRRFDPDVVLANAFDLQTVAATLPTDAPVVTKVVGDNAWERARRAGIVDDDIETFQEHWYSPKVTFLKLLRTIQTRGVDHVVVPSEYLRELVIDWGVPRERTSVIYNAVDVDPPDVDEADRNPWVTTVGRLVDWKGIEGVVEAFAEMDDRPADAELHIVGNGPKRETLEGQVAATDCEDSVVFHSRVPHDEVLQILSQSQVFALNSTYEGLPHVVLEAMACGTPVVASKAGGTVETITDGKSGFLVDQGATGAFSDRFEQLLNDDALRQSFREEAYALLDHRFKFDSMVTAYEQLLADLEEGHDG